MCSFIVKHTVGVLINLPGLQPIGPEEQFDLGEWRLLPREDKQDRFSLTRDRPSEPGQPTMITLKVKPSMLL